MEFDKTYSLAGNRYQQDPGVRSPAQRLLPAFLHPALGRPNGGRIQQSGRRRTADSLGDMARRREPDRRPAASQGFRQRFRRNRDDRSIRLRHRRPQGRRPARLELDDAVTSHIVNTINYNEANYNGPALVPFQYLDQQPTNEHQERARYAASLQRRRLRVLVGMGDELRRRRVSR